MRASSTQRVQQYRAGLRLKGLKPVQIWVPDTHQQGFALACKKQSLLAKKDDLNHEVDLFIAQAADLRGWE